MKKIFLLLIISFCFFTAASHAAVKHITIDRKSGFFIDYNYDEDDPATSIESKDFSAKAGEFIINSSGLEPAAFCLELGVPEGTGNADLLWLSPTSIPLSYLNAYHAAWLMDQYSTGLGYTGYLGSTADKNVADAALQIAIWSTINDYSESSNQYIGSIFENIEIDNYLKNPDDGDNFDPINPTPDGHLEELAWELAAEYKKALIDATDSDDGLYENDFSGLYRFAFADFKDDQDLLVAKAVPVPSSILLLVSGLLGLSRLRRKQS